MKKLIFSCFITLCYLTYAYSQQSISCYPDNSNRWTGSISKVISSYPITDDELIVGTPLQYRGWAKFNLSDIPDNATIDKVTIRLYVNQASALPSSYELLGNSIYLDPVTASSSTLWDAIDNLSNYFVNPGWGDVVGTVSGSISNWINDIQSSLARNWFAVDLWSKTKMLLFVILMGTPLLTILCCLSISVFRLQQVYRQQMELFVIK